MVKRPKSIIGNTPNCKSLQVPPIIVLISKTTIYYAYTYEHVTGERIYPPSLAHWSWRVCFYHKTKTNGPNKILFQFEEEKIISFHMSKFQLIMTNSLRFISQENTPTFKKQRWWITRFSSDMLIWACHWWNGLSTTSVFWKSECFLGL